MTKEENLALEKIVAALPTKTDTFLTTLWRKLLWTADAAPQDKQLDDIKAIAATQPTRLIESYKLLEYISVIGELERMTFKESVKLAGTLDFKEDSTTYSTITQLIALGTKQFSYTDFDSDVVNPLINAVNSQME